MFIPPKYTNICNLSSIVKVLQNGSIYMQNKEVLKLYQVNSINVLEENIELKENIYNAYTVFTRGMEKPYSLVGMSVPFSFKKEKSILIEQMQTSCCMNMKELIQAYINKIESLSLGATNTYCNFIITTEEEEKMQILFSQLGDYGITIKKISTKKETSKILARMYRKSGGDMLEPI